MDILSVAYGFAAVTADPAGGAEQVLAALDRALVAAGNRSRVIACEGSATAGELIAFPTADDPDDEVERGRIHATMRARIAEVVEDDPPDLLHLHGLDFADYLPEAGPPVLITLHLPLAWYSEAGLRTARPRTIFQPVSRDQAARAPSGMALAPAIANGVDVGLYRPMSKRNYTLVIGRMAPEKGFHHALTAARSADVELLAAGQLYPYDAHRRYFSDEVQPLLDDRRRWLGPVAGAEKCRLLAEARCLLVPSTAPETSSLVAMEALASGTPVIAFRAGALPEIVEDGVTGFVVDTTEQMAAAIGRVDAIDPAACRRAAEERFPLSRTIATYFDLYRRLAA